MKTWRNISILFALVSFAACSKVENVYVPEAISYSVGSYASATKANSEFRAYEGLTTFNSKSFIHAEGAANGTVFFESSIIWDGAVWAPTHDYYWPKHPQSYLNFVSWYAKNGSADIVPLVVTETEFRIADHEIGAQDRILIADEAWRQTSNITPGTYYTPGVPTLFHHLLSRVKVNMKAAPLTDPDLTGVTYEVSLQEAHFEGVYKSGSLALTNSPLTSAGTRAWSNSANPTYLWNKTAGSNSGSIVLSNSNVSLGDTNVPILAERSFLPQDLANIKLVLTYTIVTKSNNVVTSTESDIPATVVLNTVKNSTNNLISQWLPNKIYTYNILINPVGSEILLEPQVSDWTFADPMSVTVE